MAKRRVKFREVQRWAGWLRGVILASLACTLFLIVREVMSLASLGAGFWGRVLLLVFALGCHWLFYCLSLCTEVRVDGLRITYHPVRRQSIPFGDIAGCEVRTYQAIQEYGGWGVRGSRSNRAYTFRGRDGVQLELKNGDRVLVGSERPEDLAQAIQSGMPDLK